MHPFISNRLVVKKFENKEIFIFHFRFVIFSENKISIIVVDFRSSILLFEIVLHRGNETRKSAIILHYLAKHITSNRFSIRGNTVSCMRNSFANSNYQNMHSFAHRMKRKTKTKRKESQRPVL